MKPLDRVEPRTQINSLPMTITESGSYYLTDDFQVASTAITIATADVTVDLMGHTIAGSTGTGILSQTGSDRVTIKNGTLRGFKGNGVDLSQSIHSRVVDVKALDNDFTGIHVGPAGLVLRCEAGRNTTGLRVSDGGIIRHGVAYDNTGTGLFAGVASIVADSTARDNGSNGIFAAERSLITNCTSTNNQGRGIFSNGRGRIAGCTVDENDLEGIFVNGNDVQIVNNLVSGSLREGIEVDGTRSSIRENLVTENAFDGIQVGVSSNLGFHAVVENTVTMPDTVAPGHDKAGIRFYGARGLVDRNVTNGAPIDPDGANAKNIRIVGDVFPHGICVVRNYARLGTLEIGTSVCPNPPYPWYNLQP